MYDDRPSSSACLFCPGLHDSGGKPGFLWGSQGREWEGTFHGSSLYIYGPLDPAFNHLKQQIQDGPNPEDGDVLQRI